MIQRLLYYSQLRKGIKRKFQEIIKEEETKLLKEWAAWGLSHVSVFTCEPYVCMYAEVVGGSRISGWDWPMSFDRYLEKWPLEPQQVSSSRGTFYRLALPMIDVFHDGVPSDSDFGRRSAPNAERIGSIARLRPEMASSYIYYHYQKQEESPDSFNQTYMIGSLGTLLFSYHELPSGVSPIKRQGLLTTKYTPDNWHEVMYPHFEQWEEAP
ncbi:hypothetical protein [Paenibacillus macquariensis]|uniref:Uncharacterized protein n=1 Tax=Paenibacillus macquariensis TaxID=948756 RepID=A0ABY1JKV4_9BACL|nr:hypothetical protein [Paenibacillus macquariensis]MEC0090020.1 hypothetical protein [Paenibacillus macquariensis]OAB31097.1 hypothetical protein PMSM_20450 [Paenibacillus macquariensis subsp. macquariensis]SIQ36227.1 hypothetical protein SAMN05421578_101406 [Paenibacillus macquariensis]